MGMRKKIIHTNRHVIASNKKNGKNEPVFSIKERGCKTRYGHSVVTEGPCKLVYSPDKPLSCGATAWIETYGDVVVFRNEQ